MDCIQKLQEYLREEGVPFTIQHHPRLYKAIDIAGSEDIAGSLMAKIVMVVANGKLVMLVVPCTDRVYLPEVARVLGAQQLRLAQEREFTRVFTGCEKGAMPPFGNLFNVPVYVDTIISAEDTIYFQVGTHTDTMSIRYADFERLVRPTTAAFSVEEALQSVA